MTLELAEPSRKALRKLLDDFRRADKAWHEELLRDKAEKPGPDRTKVIDDYRKAIKALSRGLIEQNVIDFSEAMPLQGLALEMKEGREVDPSVTPHMLVGGCSFGDEVGELRRQCWMLLPMLEARLAAKESAELRGVLDDLGAAEQETLLAIDGRGRLTKSNFDYAQRPFSLLEPGAIAEPTIQSPHQAFARLLVYNSASRVTDVYAGDQVRVRLFYDGPGRLIGRETPSAGINGYVSWYHGRDVYNRDAIGRVLVSGSFYGPAAPTMGMIVEETYLQDSLGRKHRESFRFGGGGANWVDIVSSYSGTDWFRSGLAYQNNLGGGANDLTMNLVPDAVGRLGELKWQTSAGGAMNLLAKYWHHGSAISRRDTYHAVGFFWKTDYIYDNHGRMNRIDHRFGALAPFSTFDFEYDDASNLEKEWYPRPGGGVGDRFRYDEHHRLLKAWLGADTAKMNAADPEAAQSGMFIKKLTYYLDAANNRDNVVTELGAGGSPPPEDYTTQDAPPQGPSNRYLTVAGVALTHDQRGNTVFDGNLWYVYDDLDRLTEVWGFQETDQVTVTSGSSLAPPSPTSSHYSLNDQAAVVAARAAVLGRLPSGPSDVLRRPTQLLLGSLAERLPRLTVSRQGTTQAASSSEEEWMVLRALYLYDGAERRVTRTVIPLGKTWFYAYDGWEEVQEMAFATQTVPEKQFVWGKQLDELVAYRWKPAGAWTSYFIAEGGAHCPVKVLDSAGVVREIQEYDSYGKTTFYPVGGGAYGDSLYGNPFRWKGHRVDLETGLVCMRHRYYSPRLGRFVSQDPLGVWADMATGGNSYSYGRGNPLTDTDRSGLQVAVAGSNLLGFFSTPAGLEASFGDGTSLLLTPGAGDAGSQIQLLEEVGSAAEARTAWEAEFAKVLGEEFARQMFLQEVSENAERLMNSCLEGWIGLKLLTEMGGGSGRVMSTGLTEGELRSLATAYSNAMSRMAAGLGVQANGARVGLNGRQLWGRADTLDDHFLRHGADFGARNADDYAQQASDFFRRSQADSLPTKIDPDGTIRVYDRASNTFGAYNASGTTRTFYKPDPATHGYPTNLDYWNAQPGSAPWMPK